MLFESLPSLKPQQTKPGLGNIICRSARPFETNNTAEQDSEAQFLEQPLKGASPLGQLKLKLSRHLKAPEPQTGLFPLYPDSSLLKSRVSDAIFSLICT